MNLGRSSKTFSNALFSNAFVSNACNECNAGPLDRRKRKKDSEAGLYEYLCFRIGVTMSLGSIPAQTKMVFLSSGIRR